MAKRQHGWADEIHASADCSPNEAKTVARRPKGQLDSGCSPEKPHLHLEFGKKWMGA